MCLRVNSSRCRRSHPSWKIETSSIAAANDHGAPDQHSRISANRRCQGLNAEKMKECRWLKPALIGQFEFVEWTADGHLRHARFIRLLEDQEPRDVVRSPERTKSEI